MATKLDGIDEATASRVTRNVDLVHRHLLAIIADPSLLERIPDGGAVVLIPDDDPELAAANLEGGMRRVRQGEDVTFLHVRPQAEPGDPDHQAAEFTTPTE